MRKKILVVGILTVFATIYACKKEKKTAPLYNPTYTTVDVPAFAKTYLGDMPHPADNPLTVEGIALGRMLFYEKMISNDKSMSCASCHKQANAFDDPRPFSQGTNGVFGDRNAMALVNMGWDRHFFWDGRRSSLEGQAHDPVTNPIEMANTWTEVVTRLQNSSTYPDLFFKAFGTNTVDSSLTMKAIAQFERTLVSFNSKFDKYHHQGDTTVFTQQEKNGLNIFAGKGMCNNCHLMNTLLTDRDLKNNGLDVNPADAGLMKFTGNANDRGKFKVPTLRNIEVSAPYMHDSRFGTLEDVVNFYSSGVKQSSPNIDEHMPDFGSGLNLTAQEKADLIAFLKTLTDQTFLTNPKFSNPH
ncbi:MAG: cytochrome-c peroxidase [Taibaiella sp.]|nr:cytochrome-c peroxidase [Taibaiella sp.]